MIRYDNGKPFAIIFHTTGSVLPSCMPVGITTFLMGLTLAIIRELDKDSKTLFLTQEKYGKMWIFDPFALQVIAIVIGYLLVVRTNMALGRWMEGISDIQLMLSKWTDAYDALSAFFAGKKGTKEVLEETLMFRIRIAHWFSLMSCLCFATLRAGGHLGDLEEVPIKELFEDVKEKKSQRSKSFAASRIVRAPEGHHASRRSWGSAFVGANPHIEPTGSAASKKANSEEKNEPILTEGLDLLVLSMPTAEEVHLLEMATDKPHTISLWIIQAVVLAIRKKLLDVPPPIISRVFQELSNGMLGFNQAHKVAMVPFPFPFAQMVSLLLVILYFFLPFYIDVFTQHPVITPAVSFLLPMVYCALNSIAIELEAPFGTDMNDIDIEVRHQEFLWSLVDVLQAPKYCPEEKEPWLEEEIIRGVLKGCSYIAPELSDYVPDKSFFDPTASGGWQFVSPSEESTRS
mmetsp:Transcript_96348/g.185049  ORF Transcript_96348/g.185049 Transcript_96348/m.185049 type:complete len:459 (-) Transcript_96348:62-1438(-)